MMKRIIALFAVLCLLLAGCASAKEEEAAAPAETEVTETAASEEAAEAEAEEEPAEPEEEAEEPAEVEAEEAAEPAQEAKTISPLPDPTMDNLNDAIFPVSLEAGAAYTDESGIMQLDLTIYAYDKFDMVDIAMLQVGDTIARSSGEVEVTSMEESESGAILINGGLEAGGFDLVTDDSGIYYEMGFNDTKNWYAVGAATLPASDAFTLTDGADIEQGELTYAGTALIDEVTNYDFTPYNTTVRVEAGQIVEMIRVYTP